MDTNTNTQLQDAWPKHVEVAYHTQNDGKPGLFRAETAEELTGLVQALTNSLKAATALASPGVLAVSQRHGLHIHVTYWKKSIPHAVGVAVEVGSLQFCEWPGRYGLDVFSMRESELLQQARDACPVFRSREDTVTVIELKTLPPREYVRDDLRDVRSMRRGVRGVLLSCLQQYQFDWRQQESKEYAASQPFVPPLTVVIDDDGDDDDDM